jgi:CrcB protein
MELGNFPFGILFVNIFGSFLIGILYAYFSTHDVSTILKAFLIAGFLGGLTTFSTFALDSYLLFNSSLNYAILNILSNLIGSIFFVLIGFKLAIFFIK